MMGRFFIAISYLLYAVSCFSQYAPKKGEIFVPNSARQIIYGKVVDQTGAPLLARVELWQQPLAKACSGFGADTIGIRDNLIACTYTKASGYYSLQAPQGTFLIKATHGPEWEMKKDTIEIESLEFAGLRYDIMLRQLFDMQKKGWFAGDPHLHSYFSDGYNAPAEVAHAAQCSGLSWAVLTDHNTMAGVAEWLATETKEFLPIAGNEVTTEDTEISTANGFGHENQLFIQKVLGGARVNSDNIWERAALNDHQDLQRIIDGTHEQEGLLIINHPCQTWESEIRFKSWGLVRAFDAIEVWNGEPPHRPTMSNWADYNLNTINVQFWFEFLNAGNKMVGLAGSDCHDVTGYMSWPKEMNYWHGFCGNPQTYVYLEKFNRTAIKKALTEGNVFLTSDFGPLILFHLQNKIPGQVLKLRPNTAVQMNIDIFLHEPFLINDNNVRIIKNGSIWKELSTQQESIFTSSFGVAFEKDSWVLIEAFGNYPAVAITNPVFIDVFPFGDWEVTQWKEPANCGDWNTFHVHPEITVPDFHENPENISGH